MNLNTLIKITTRTSAGSSVTHPTVGQALEWACNAHGHNKIYPHFHEDGRWKFYELPLRRQLNIACNATTTQDARVTWEEVKLARGQIIYWVMFWILLAAMVWMAGNYRDWADNEAAHLAAADKAFWECKSGNGEGGGR